MQIVNVGFLLMNVKKEECNEFSQTCLHPWGAGTQPADIADVCGIGPHHAMRMDCEQCASWRGVEKYADC